MTSRKLSRELLLASVGLYLVSLALNAFCTGKAEGERCDDSLGVALLALGWLETIAIGEVGPFVALPWYANPCLFVAWGSALDQRRKIAVAFAGLGILLGASFLLGHSVQISEGGGADPITGYRAGYWVWLGSLVLAFLSALATPRKQPADAQDTAGSRARVSGISAGTTAVRVRATST